MRGINIPPFRKKVIITDLDVLLRNRLDKLTVMWPDQALPLLGYMCFPNDEAGRNELLCTLWSWQDDPKRPVLPRKLNRIQASWLRVADIYHLYCDMVGGGHQERRGGPSLGKAVTLTAKKLSNRGTSESTLWDLWRDYKDVAHLVTAASLVHAEVRRRYNLGLLPHSALDPEQIIPFQLTMLLPDLVLAVAMDFQRVGLAIGFDGTINPVLDPDTLWRVPTDTDLEIVPLPLPVRKLTPPDLVILNDRRAGNRGRANLKADPGYQTQPMSMPPSGDAA